MTPRPITLGTSWLALLEPITRQLVQSIVAAAQQMGIALMVYETYRSKSRQQDLFDNGAIPK